MKAKVFDLSSYLEEKPSTIKLGDEEFTISEGFNDLLKIDALTNRKEDMSSTEFIKEFMEISLGKESAEKILSKNYPIKIYVQIMNCIEQVYSGMSEDEEGPSSNERTELV